MLKQASAWFGGLFFSGKQKSSPLVSSTKIKMDEALLQNTDSLPSSSVSMSPGNRIASRASLGTTSFNLVNNMVGSGLLTIPWCMKQLGGSFEGTVFLAVLAGVTWSSFALIGLVCSRVKGVRTFDELAALAGFSQNATKVLLALYTWLSCVSYVLLTCDFVAGSAGLSRYEWACTRNSNCSWLITPFHHRYAVVLFLILFVLYPFSRFKDFNSLKQISIASFFAMLCMMVVALHLFITRNDSNSHDDDSPEESTEFFRGIFLAHPIFLISYTAHYNAPKFYAELENPSSTRFALSSAIAVFAAFLIYGFFGIVSHETFGGKTHPNVLENYASDSLIAVFARFTMAVVVLTTYPLAYQALKGAVTSFVDENRSQMVDYALILATSIPAALVRDIGVVLDYKGAVLGGVVALLVPALAFIRVSLNALTGAPLTAELREVELTEDALATTPILAKERWVQYGIWSRILVGWAAVASVGGFVVTTLRLVGYFEED